VVLFRPERGQQRLRRFTIAKGEDEMLPASELTYVYDPEALKMMGAAFDTVCEAFPPDMKDHEAARRKLALLILRHVERGERDAARLSELALLDFMQPLASGQG
jgi:hypothetical protein